MRRAIIFFIIMLFGDFLCARYFHDQSAFRFLALIGFLTVIVSVFMFSTYFSGLFETKTNKRFDKSLNNKTGYIFVIMLLLLIVLHVVGFIKYDRYQSELLEKNGIYTETEIIDKTWESRGKESAGYYVHYVYSYRGVKYIHDKKVDSFEIGETIRVRFLPENPDNHTIMKK